MSLRDFGKRAKRLFMTLLYRPRALLLLRGCEQADGVLVFGEIAVTAKGRISIGQNVHFRKGIAPQEFFCETGAEIVVGPGVTFNYGGVVRAIKSVRIGANCLIGSFARLDDSAPGFAAGPIVVEDDVWIAHGAVIAPGVRIGRGSAVAAGSLVLQDVPANTLAMGNPARCFPLDMLAKE